jgi:hypothetical protein
MGWHKLERECQKREIDWQMHEMSWKWREMTSEMREIECQEREIWRNSPAAPERHGYGSADVSPA